MSSSSPFKMIILAGLILAAFSAARAALPAPGTAVHASDFYLRQVRSLTECASDGIPRIACAAVEGEPMRRKASARARSWQAMSIYTLPPAPQRRDGSSNVVRN